MSHNFSAPHTGRDEAQLEATAALIFDKQIASQLVEEMSLVEKITSADIQDGVDDIEALLAQLGITAQVIPDDVIQALKTNCKEVFYLLAKAHGGLQKK